MAFQRAAVGGLCLGLAILSGGTLGAAPSGADDTSADKFRQVTTPDGWDISIDKTGETLDRVPPLDAAAFSREAFLTVNAKGVIGGNGTEAVLAGTVSLAVMIGCNTDASSGLFLGLGGTFGSGAEAGEAGTGGGQSGTIQTDGGNVSNGILPVVQLTLRPGSITTITLGTRQLVGPTGELDLDQIPVHVDSCIGQVALRTVATMAVSTATVDKTVTVYGDPVTF